MSYHFINFFFAWTRARHIDDMYFDAKYNIAETFEKQKHKMKMSSSLEFLYLR